MQTTSQTAPARTPAPTSNADKARRVEDLTYQALTIAAALLLLGSLWIF
jgi:hypothetical protein